MASRNHLVLSIVNHPYLVERPNMVKGTLAVFFGMERAEAHMRRLILGEPAEVVSGRPRSDTAILACTLRAQGFHVRISERAAAGPG